MMRKQFGLLTIALILASTVSARDASDEYAAHLKRIEAVLEKGDYSRAKRKAANFEREMLDWIIAGPEVPKYLEEIAKLHAIALAGVGDLNHAAWKWHMAGEFSPTVTDDVLKGYGIAGEKLREHLTHELDGIHEGPTVTFTNGFHPSVTPPKVVKSPEPRYPRPQAKLDLECNLTVNVVIDTDGVPRHPEILASGGRPTLVYTTMLALRKWRFEPASKDQNPIPVFYVLSVRFHPH